MVFDVFVVLVFDCVVVLNQIKFVIKIKLYGEIYVQILFELVFLVFLFDLIKMKCFFK